MSKRKSKSEDLWISPKRQQDMRRRRNPVVRLRLLLGGWLFLLRRSLGIRRRQTGKQGFNAIVALFWSLFREWLKTPSGRVVGAAVFLTLAWILVNGLPSNILGK